MNKLLLVSILIILTLCSDQGSEAQFFANKIKTIVNLIFDQTTYGVVNIPFFPSITLEKFKIDDLSYSYTNNHNLRANVTIKADVLGSALSNSFMIAMEFKVENGNTIPVSYEFEISSPSKDMVLGLMTKEAKKMLNQLIGKELPYNIFPAFISLPSREEGGNYEVNFDVSEYMNQQKQIMDEKSNNKQQKQVVEEVEL